LWPIRSSRSRPSPRSRGNDITTTLTDSEAIQNVVRTFFEAFTSGPDSAERLDALRAIFVPTAVIARTCGLEPAVYSVDEFIAPRAALLTSGDLVDFKEWAVGGRVDVFGDIAHWFGSYAKEGVQNGKPFTGRGMKTMQFIRTADGWRITAAAWDDERPGLTMDPS
jgi:hypothetical protein